MCSLLGRLQYAGWRCQGPLECKTHWHCAANQLLRIVNKDGFRTVTVTVLLLRHGGELVIEAALGEQFVVGACLHDLAFAHARDHPSITDGREPVGDRDGRPPLRLDEAIERGLHKLLRLVVESACCLFIGVGGSS